MCRSSPPPSSALLVSHPARSGSQYNQSGDTGEELGRLHRVLPSTVPGVPVSDGSDGGGSPVGGVGATWERVGGGGHPTALVGCCCACCVRVEPAVCVPAWGCGWGGSPAQCRFPAPLTQALLVPQQEHRRVCFGGAGEGPERAPAQRASAEPNLSCSPPAAARGLPDAQQAARLCGSHDLLPVYLNPAPD